MSAQQPPGEFQEFKLEPQTEKLKRKSKEFPFMPIGLAGLVCMVTYGIYSHRKRGGMSTSMHVMKYRVFAQGTVVGALGLGILVSIYNDYIAKKK